MEDYDTEIILKEQCLKMNSKKNDVPCMKFSNKEKQRIGENVSQGFVMFFADNGEVIQDFEKEDIEWISFDEKDCVAIRFLGFWTSIFFGDELELMFIDDNDKGHFTSEDTDYNTVYEGKLDELTHNEICEMFSEILIILTKAESVTVEEQDTYECCDRVYRQYKPLNYIVRVKSKENNSYIKSYCNIEFRVNC